MFELLWVEFFLICKVCLLEQMTLAALSFHRWFLVYSWTASFLSKAAKDGNRKDVALNRSQHLNLIVSISYK